MILIWFDLTGVHKQFHRSYYNFVVHNINFSYYLSFHYNYFFIVFIYKLVNQQIQKFLFLADQMPGSVAKQQSELISDSLIYGGNLEWKPLTQRSAKSLLDWKKDY